ncbi:MAG: CRTAC1 family protein [Pseudomonadota bacterium]
MVKWRGLSPAFAALLLAASIVNAAEIQFEPRLSALPEDHVYDGGWEHFVGGGVAAFDCNDDDLPDLAMAGGENSARVYINESEIGADIRFKTGPVLSENKSVTGLYPLDIDSDGILDLAVLRVGPNSLMRGLGGCQFEDESVDWDFATSKLRWSTAFSATWEGDNAFPTLAIGNYVDRDDPDGPFEACDPNEVHRPVDGQFEKFIQLMPGYCALSILFSDWARTGETMLRLSNDRHYYVRGGFEEMWRLDPLAPLTEDDGWERVSLWGMGIASRDISGDGRPDVMLTSMGDQLLQFVDGPPNTPSLRNAPFALGTYAQRPFIGDDGRPSTGWHAEFGDVNNDGRDDLFITKGNVDQMPGNAMEDPNNLLIQNGDGTFTEVAHIAGVASMHRGRGGALVDLNADGLLDMVVVNRRAPAEIFENVTADTGNWASIDPQIEGPNTRAVGSWIEVKTPDGRIQAREVTVGGGHAGGQAVAHHFGLGEHETFDVRVEWPDGRISNWKTLSKGERYTVSPGDENTLTINW